MGFKILLFNTHIVKIRNQTIDLDKVKGQSDKKCIYNLKNYLPTFHNFDRDCSNLQELKSEKFNYI